MRATAGDAHRTAATRQPDREPWWTAPGSCPGSGSDSDLSGGYGVRCGGSPKTRSRWCWTSPAAGPRTSPQGVDCTSERQSSDADRSLTRAGSSFVSWWTGPKAARSPTCTKGRGATRGLTAATLDPGGSATDAGVATCAMTAPVRRALAGTTTREGVATSGSGTARAGRIRLEPFHRAELRPHVGRLAAGCSSPVRWWRRSSWGRGLAS